jgi:hypothetical protein
LEEIGLGQHAVLERHLLQPAGAERRQIEPAAGEGDVSHERLEQAESGLAVGDPGATAHAVRRLDARRLAIASVELRQLRKTLRRPMYIIFSFVQRLLLVFVPLCVRAFRRA